MCASSVSKRSLSKDSLLLADTHSDVVDPNFFDNISWTDESSGKRDGIFNKHILQCWPIENSNSIRPCDFQYNLKLMFGQ